MAKASKADSISEAMVVDGAGGTNTLKAKKNKLVRPRGKRGGIKKKHVKDEVTGKWRRTNIPATPKKNAADRVKGQGAKDDSEAKEKSSAHASHISQFHALKKRLASPGTSAAERSKLEKELSELGGLEAYQNASITGASTFGESGRWVHGALLRACGVQTEAGQDAPEDAEQRADRAESSIKLRLLDVGAIGGTAFQQYAGTIETVSIDLNPRSTKVFQADFLDCPTPPHRIEAAGRSGEGNANTPAILPVEGPEDATTSFLPEQHVHAGFDAVNLSLVLNFEGDLAKRGEMLLRPHAFLRAPRLDDAGDHQQPTPDGGFLSLILPLPCIARSRYCTQEHLSSLLSATGWEVVEQQDSKRLTRWLLRERRDIRKPGEIGCDDVWARWWNGEEFGRKELRVGVHFNNFCIKLGRVSLANESGPEAEPLPTSKPQRIVSKAKKGASRSKAKKSA